MYWPRLLAWLTSVSLVTTLLLALTGAWAQSPAAPPAAAETDTDRKSTRLNSSHIQKSRMPSSA